MRSIGLRDSRDVRRLRAAHALVAHPAPRRRAAGVRRRQVHDRVGHDLAAGGRSGSRRAGSGRCAAASPGFTAADGRYLLWLAAHVRDAPKLDRVRRGIRASLVLHKAGWISTARHDTGLVFWRGGVFVAGVMTWSSHGVGDLRRRARRPRRRRPRCSASAAPRADNACNRLLQGHGVFERAALRPCNRLLQRLDAATARSRYSF